MRDREDLESDLGGEPDDKDDEVSKPSLALSRADESKLKIFSQMTNLNIIEEVPQKEGDTEDAVSILSTESKKKNRVDESQKQLMES